MRRRWRPSIRSGDVSARQAHSGTHVVHAALRQVLGPTALQSRFAQPPGLSAAGLRVGTRAGRAVRAADIEDVSNQALRRDLPVAVRYMPLEQAREIGALALFGETYDQTVRVVEIGGPWSRELCGGTHVERSSQIGTVTIIGESSIGSGVRRVEAYVGLEAMRYLATERAIVVAAVRDPQGQAGRVAWTGWRSWWSGCGRPSGNSRRCGPPRCSRAPARWRRQRSRSGALARSWPRRPAGCRWQRPARAGAGRPRPAAGERSGSRAACLAGGRLQRCGRVRRRGERARPGDRSRGRAIWSRCSPPIIGARGGGKADVAQGAGGDASRLPEALRAARAYLADHA